MLESDVVILLQSERVLERPWCLIELVTAIDNDVPIVENPPLARALFDVADIDEEIPPEHYKAVAEVISYVFQLKKKPLH